MGPLTRKRATIDLTTPAHPSKKSKSNSQLLPNYYSPLFSLSREFHAPQRGINVFDQKSREGSNSLSNLKFQSPKSKEISNNLNQEIVKLGNFVSPCYESKKKEGLGLEDYRKLVDNLGYKKTKFSSRLGLETVSEARVLRTTECLDLDRKSKILVQREPIYKELYKKAISRDLRDLEYELKLTEEKLSAFRLVDKSQEEKPKKDLKELLRPLTDEEEAEVSSALRRENRHKLLANHEASNIQITGHVLQCLRPRTWLNDEVINLYLELMKERERREPKKFLKCHFFNTFFYKKLIIGKNGYDFKAVKRWTTRRKLGYGLIECDKIFVPIHKDIHWCLAVIDVKGRTFQYLDSLAGRDTVVLEVLARYFSDEVNDKSNKQINTMSWKQEIVDDLPLQQNGWDCGMFMLKYIDFYARGLDLCFSQVQMAYFRKRTVKEILRLRVE